MTTDQQETNDRPETQHGHVQEIVIELGRLRPQLIRGARMLVETVTRSKSRCRNIRYVVSKSGNSWTHGPHQVAQKLINRTFPEPFDRSAFKPAADTGSTRTGSASIFAMS